MNPQIDDIPKGLVYLSMPYTHEETRVKYQRMSHFWNTAAMLIDLGVHVISPMSMEPTLTRSKRGDDWETWERYCCALLEASEEIWVMQIEGWEQSKGVASELEYAKQHGKQVRFLEFNTSV